MVTLTSDPLSSNPLSSNPLSSNPPIPADAYRDRDFLTPSRHVLLEFGNYSAAAQEFSALLGRISLAGKIIARRLSQSGLVENSLGITGLVNVQGEEQQQMDDYANRAFLRALEQSGLVCRIVSEEMTTPARLPENCPLSRYTLLMDPLDGSSNIDADLTVGSIFSIIRTQGEDEGNNEDLLQPGKNQLAAGYILYGPSTQLVYTMGKGVHSFTLDPSLGEFILSQSNIRIPQRGSTYSTNEGNFCQWSGGMQEYIRFVHRHDGFTARYSGALVADVHRILLKGGVYLYPGTLKKPEGKLRLLYEASPLGLIIEQAGGVATTGEVPILEIYPESLHQRVPLIIGSPDNVTEVLECFKTAAAPYCD